MVYCVTYVVRYESYSCAMNHEQTTLTPIRLLSLLLAQTLHRFGDDRLRRPTLCAPRGACAPTHTHTHTLTNLLRKEGNQ